MNMILDQEIVINFYEKKFQHITLNELEIFYTIYINKYVNNLGI
jgi:hypothetical protein